MENLLIEQGGKSLSLFGPKYSFMKFAQNNHPTFLFGPICLFGTWEYLYFWLPFFFSLAHDSCQGDSGGPLMNIRQENGESKYEWVGKFALKFVLFITCNYYKITNS